MYDLALQDQQLLVIDKGE